MKKKLLTVLLTVFVACLGGACVTLFAGCGMFDKEYCVTVTLTAQMDKMDVQVSGRDKGDGKRYVRKGEECYLSIRWENKRFRPDESFKAFANGAEINLQPRCEEFDGIVNGFSGAFKVTSDVNVTFEGELAGYTGNITFSYGNLSSETEWAGKDGLTNAERGKMFIKFENYERFTGLTKAVYSMTEFKALVESGNPGVQNASSCDDYVIYIYTQGYEYAFRDIILSVPDTGTSTRGIGKSCVYVDETNGYYGYEYNLYIYEDTELNINPESAPIYLDCDRVSGTFPGWAESLKVNGEQIDLKGNRETRQYGGVLLASDFAGGSANIEIKLKYFNEALYENAYRQMSLYYCSGDRVFDSKKIQYGISADGVLSFGLQRPYKTAEPDEATGRLNSDWLFSVYLHCDLPKLLSAASPAAVTKVGNSDYYQASVYIDHKEQPGFGLLQFDRTNSLGVDFIELNRDVEQGVTYYEENAAYLFFTADKIRYTYWGAPGQDFVSVTVFDPSPIPATFVNLEDSAWSGCYIFEVEASVYFRSVTFNTAQN